MQNEGYNYGSMIIEQNQFSGGATVQFDYKYVVSDKPGDMGASSFEGRCENIDSRSQGYLVMSPTLSSKFYCKVSAGGIR